MASKASASGRPTKTPATHYGPSDNPLHITGAWIWAPLKRQWLSATPEERVRQGFIYRLHSQWGYALEQMRQEVRTQRGRGSSRADVVVAESGDAASQNRDWRIVVEAKAENVSIDPGDYGQGESYARAIGAEFLVMHNQKQTSYFRLIPGAPGERVEINGIPRDDELHNARRLDEIRRATKIFTRDEFQRLLFECHSILRDNHKMDPGAAFDEISKILFIKMAFERQNRAEVFTTDRLRAFARTSLIGEDDPAVLNQLFAVTKQFYKADQLFGERETLRASLATFKRIVALLEKFNLSDTGDDVKGIAFERFLGETFRGELGQFFTPRPIVDFMVEMLDPVEGETICDPASGTGGFLIKAFEYLRSQVEREVQEAKTKETKKLTDLAKKGGWSQDTLAASLDRVHADLNRDLDVSNSDSRVYRIAHDCIFGTDAEARAARTSKMNMIMHGDGHGGIHYHDGLIDVNGIFEGRFNVVVTNPPFGANVGRDQIIGATEQTRVDSEPDVIKAYKKIYGSDWVQTHEFLVEAARDRWPILQLFDIGRDPIGGPVSTAKVRKNRYTETLFLERCIDLLKAGGRMGIVLPDGILNNPSSDWLREYAEGCAKLTAVISIPQDVFASAKATVKTSLVFLQKLTTGEEGQWSAARIEAEKQVDAELSPDIQRLEALETRVRNYGRDELAPLVEQLENLLGSDDAPVASIRAARAALKASVTAEDLTRRQELRREAETVARDLERKRAQMTRQRVKELTDYPVFMAEVSAAGITSTGETGSHVPNELPEIVQSYRRFLKDQTGFADEVRQRLVEEATGAASA